MRVLLIVTAISRGLLLLALALADTSPGREVIRFAFTKYSSRMQRGTIQTRELTDVGLERWLFRDYRVLGQAGWEVLLIPEMEVNWDASAPLHTGEVRLWARMVQESSDTLVES